jgi:hypothetical protein
MGDDTDWEALPPDLMKGREIRLGDELWAEVKEVMGRRPWAGDLDAIQVPTTMPDGRIKVMPLRRACEFALSAHAMSRESRKAWPPASRSDIRKALESVRAALYRLDQAVKNPVARLYAPILPGKLPDLQQWIAGFDARICEINEGRALSGPMPPRNGVIAEGTEGLQAWLHNLVQNDPDERLIFDLAGVFEKAFERPATAADPGPALEFIRVVSRAATPPISASVRYVLEKRTNAAL